MKVREDKGGEYSYCKNTTKMNKGQELLLTVASARMLRRCTLVFLTVCFRIVLSAWLLDHQSHKGFLYQVL